MNYLACYDISEDKVRLRVAKLLLDFGDRVQRSVFELPGLSSHLEERLHGRLGGLRDLGEGDSIRLYPLCNRCLSGIVIVGHSPCPPMALPPAYVF
jgi:CRISPR-associated protein Cas2